MNFLCFSSLVKSAKKSANSIWLIAYDFQDYKVECRVNTLKIAEDIEFDDEICGFDVEMREVLDDGLNANEFGDLRSFVVKFIENILFSFRQDVVFTVLFVKI